MVTEMLERKDERIGDALRVAKDVYFLQLMIANLFFIGKSGSLTEWVLVDTGLGNSEGKIVETAEAIYGSGARPRAIILTHGHFDHIGCVKQLADKWEVPVYAHKDEFPYLNGESDYPRPDPTVGGGLMSILSPIYPRNGIDLGDRLHALPEDGSLPYMGGWKWIHTPGHTPGHISLFREEDRLLISADALTTVKQESALAVLTQEQEMHGPPAYFTTDWKAAERSVKRLRDLNPSKVVSSHGLPMEGKELTQQLEELARHFEEMAVPDHGRYVDGNE